MTGKTKNSPNGSYDALALMSRLVYEKFGDGVLPIIRDVWYKMGLTSGERLKKRLTTVDFKAAASLLAERSNKTGAMEKCEISDNLYHFSTKPGTPCRVGLKDKGCSICEAVMSVNQGQFKSICGCDVEMNISKSRATGADHCEVIFHTVNVKDE